jgi:hypothetical protein
MSNSKMSDNSNVKSTFPLRVVQVTPTQRTQRNDPEFFQCIAKRAFGLWQRRGCIHGFDVDDWILAEKELLDDCAMDPSSDFSEVHD